MRCEKFGRHALVIVLATMPAALAHGRQVVYLPPTLTAPDGDAAALYRAGCQRLEAGNPSQAIELLSQAVRADPSAVEYQLKLSDAYVAGERPEAAERLLESAFARHSGNVTVRTALARLYHRGGRLERVAELLAPVEDQLAPELLIALSEAVAREPSRRAAARTIVRRAIERFPANLPLRLSLIDAALERQRYAGALSAIDQAKQRCGCSNELHLRAARAYFELGQLLGKVEVREFRGGRAGQFFRRWLLVEEREEQDSFLCCPEQSALYQLRRALDAGLDTAEAHLMHARIWQQIGKPEVGFAIVKSREALLLENPRTEVLEVLARLAFEADALSDFARYARVQARLDPEHSQRVIKQVYMRLAERFNQRGNGKMYGKCLDRAARLDPHDVDLALRRAEAAWSAGRRRDAVESYRHVLELKPDHPQRRHIVERLGQGQTGARDPG